MLTSGDVDDALDPGYSYYQLDFIYLQAVQRFVISYKPDDLAKASPDLAEEYPTVSEDGKTVTVKLKKGIKFSPPVNREVEAKDVKYAIERCFLPQVGNGYSNLYWADVVGKDEYVDGKADEVRGLTTPDKYTLVMKFSRATGAVAAQALALPCSAPVPKEVAAKRDEGKKSTYGQYVASTGPLHGPERPEDGEGHRLPARAAHHHRAQPELGQGHRLQAGLCRPDRVRRRRRPERRQPQDHPGSMTWSVTRPICHLRLRS